MVFTLAFEQKITKLCFALSLLHALFIKVDGSFKFYGYPFFVKLFFLFRQKRVPLSLTSHVNHDTPKETKVGNK